MSDEHEGGTIGIGADPGLVRITLVEVEVTLGLLPDQADALAAAIAEAATKARLLEAHGFTTSEGQA